MRNPYLVKYFGEINENELVLEYIDGETLQDFKLNQLTISEKYSIILNIMISIEDIHLHKIMYRDLKPANIIITINKDAVLIDFDCSRNVGQSTTEFTGNLGEDGFTSPEQETGNQYSFETDIYSIGQIIYFIIFDHKIEENKQFPEKYKCIKEITKRCKGYRNNRPGISELINIFYEKICSNFDSNFLNEEKIKNTLFELTKFRIALIQYFIGIKDDDNRKKDLFIIKNIFEIFNYLMYFVDHDYDKEMMYFP